VFARSARRPRVKQDLSVFASRWGLPAAAAIAYERLLRLIETDPEAPTAVRNRGEATDVHLADSLAVLSLDSVELRGSIVDLGSGAGFPGLALAAARPDARFDLVEASRRKCGFLERAIEAAGFENARVVCMRAEEWAAAEGADRYDVALARALAPLPTLLEYAAPLMRVGGALVAWKGRRDASDEACAGRAAETLRMGEGEVTRVTPFLGAQNRHLHVYRKMAQTPAGYPRRPGMARKRPLGGR
jgi:16S rRNA (guanine527-N7)-methyltransferase